ncbi:hypothetical protein GDO81_025261 [Engystomops pustulosus]|uniref:Uncharacterized protein n=1 Tax=Engystomops pustulosus TaxID=76066 RepID=A0AAV6YSL2_ENGPU|nr:hypothetical protein GDO81_025261 [Engystomops pustulosus]
MGGVIRSVTVSGRGYVSSKSPVRIYSDCYSEILPQSYKATFADLSCSPSLISFMGISICHSCGCLNPTCYPQRQKKVMEMRYKDKCTINTEHNKTQRTIWGVTATSCSVIRPLLF